MPGLAAAEERWRLTIDKAPVGIALVSLEGQFMRVNDSLARMLGYSAEELHELTFQRITHPDDLDADLDLLGQLADGLISDYHLRKRYLHSDGHAIWADLTVGLVRNADDRPMHYVSHVIDRTDEVAATSRIEQINTDLSAQSAQLARSNADLETFAMLASHDLQAPLATIRGYMELLEHEYAAQLDERAAHWIGRVAEASDRMAQLVTSLLAFSRSGTELDLDEVSVADVVDLAEHDLAQLIEEHGATVQVAPGAPDVRADRARLRQVLQNLVQNAVKYRHPDRPPEICIGVEERVEDWLVTVDDNGLGVPAGQREQVFTMFHREDELQDGGHGIGLAACRRIVTRHGGRIWVEDNPCGEGARFAFTLPHGAGTA